MRYPLGKNGEDPIKSSITIDEFKQGFKSVAEKTSSSPSGRHLVHYKASLNDDILCLVHSTVMSIPFKLGFTLDRWLNALQVMLEKIKGTARLDKLWVIQLMEADLNMMLCIIFGHRLIHRAEDKETYVDDTELDQGDIHALAEEMQHIAQYWEQLLYTTGGALALEKCFFVAMDWKVVHDQYHLKTNKELVLDIALYSDDNMDVHTAIPQCDSSDGPRNLGARLAPRRGNNVEEMLHLILKGQTLSQNISASQLQRHKVMIDYKTMFQPCMKYPLCGTTFTAQEFAKIVRSFLPTLLTRMGFNAKTKRLLFFGSSIFGVLWLY